MLVEQSRQGAKAHKNNSRWQQGMSESKQPNVRHGLLDRD